MVDENTLGREPVVIVEIDQDKCQNTYGSAPCTAALGVTGTFKCYNTRNTCQDPTNYATGTPLTLRFCSPSSTFPSPSETYSYMPMVQSVSTNPTEVNLAGGNDNLKSLGRRASVTIKMQDEIDGDDLTDPYLSTRGFNPLERSTFWRKWLIRNPYFQNRPLRVREGYVGQSVASMRTRHYFIDKITGVDSKGGVTIVAKDILKFAEDKRAQAPAANTGVLSAAVTAIATSFDLYPAGIGSAEYPASGKVKIGDEIMSFTRSGDTMTVVRGVNNTTAEDHDLDDAVQVCLEYTNERVDSLIIDLLTTYGNIDSSYITTADWTEEADTWLSDFFLSAIVTEPTGVSKLIEEIIDQTSIIIWWDDINQKIRFKSIRPINKEAINEITEDYQIIENSFKLTREPSQRLSQSRIYYDIIDYTQDLTSAKNFKKLQISVDLQKESEDQYGQAQIRTLYSRWLGAEDAAIALSSASKQVLIYKDSPLYVEFEVDAKDRNLDIGDVVRVTHESLVDFQGTITPTLFQIISREEKQVGHRVVYKCLKFGFIGRFAFIMADDANDYTSATEEELSGGAYISDDNGLMSDGTEGWKIS